MVGMVDEVLVPGEPQRRRQLAVVCSARDLDVASPAIQCPVALLRITKALPDACRGLVLPEVRQVPSFEDRCPGIRAFVLDRRQQLRSPAQVLDLRVGFHLSPEQLDPVHLVLGEFPEGVTVSGEELRMVDLHWFPPGLITSVSGWTRGE